MCLLGIWPPFGPQYSKPWTPNIQNLPMPMDNDIGWSSPCNFCILRRTKQELCHFDYLARTLHESPTKSWMGTLTGKTAFPVSSLPALFSIGGLPLKERICSSTSKSFPLRVYSLFEGLCLPEKQTGSHKSCSPLKNCWVNTIVSMYLNLTGSPLKTEKFTVCFASINGLDAMQTAIYRRYT